jgi:hypothetical protein
VDLDPERRRRLLQEMQTLRGNIYLRDGAIQAGQLSTDGLHQTPEDERSWHLLMVDRAGRVDACVWYREHAPEAVGMEDLRVRHCPLARDEHWRKPLWSAIRADLELARAEGLGYAEVGGWGVSEKNRCTSEGLVLALAGYSLGRVLGGALGMTTATVRHCSSTILRRLGGSAFADGSTRIPSYFDPKYNCEMELLRFDSRSPSPKYAALVELLKSKLSEVLVITADVSALPEPESSFFLRRAMLPQPALAIR